MWTQVPDNKVQPFPHAIWTIVPSPTKIPLRKAVGLPCFCREPPLEATTQQSSLLWSSRHVPKIINTRYLLTPLGGLKRGGGCPLMALSGRANRADECPRTRKSSGGGFLTPKCTGHEDGRAWRQSGSRGTSRGRARRLGNAISVVTARQLARDQADPRGGKSRAAMRIFLSCSK